MKKITTSLMALCLCLGLLSGCGSTSADSQSSSVSDDGQETVQTVDSLKIAFSPYADSDTITAATALLKQLLQEKLLEKGHDVKNIEMTVGTSYTAVGEALSAGSADLGFACCQERGK
jgi:phosphonate transport system substrate-binding protein